MLDQVERRVTWKLTKWGKQRETGGEGHEIAVRQEERKYKDSKTGYTATIELVDEYIDDNYTAKVHFKDGNAFTEFYFTFNTTSNKIISTRNMTVDYPFRNDVKLDSERNLTIEQTNYGTRAWIYFSSKTQYSYAEQSCCVELRDEGLLYIRRFVLDSHIKGGYDGHTFILLDDR